MAYSIGQAALILDVAVPTLKNWERRGLVPKPRRSPTNHRRYTEVDIAGIREFLKKRR